MNILVTGSKGFIGRNLVSELRNKRKDSIFEYDKDTNPDLLEEYCKEADFVFHLAGINRPIKESDYMEGNHGFTQSILGFLEEHQNKCTIMLSSSVQACIDNPYGLSKRAGEDAVFNYSKRTGAKVLVYRFPNVFGKWCQPNYNSAIATFCYNINRDLPISVNDPSAVLTLVYIDDIVEELINALDGKENKTGDYCEVKVKHTISIGEIVDLLYSFKRSRDELFIPDMSEPFVKKLYSTYLSYLPEDRFNYFLKMNNDNRGSFTEFIRTTDRGQIAVNIAKPGITKGNHWHHNKHEKFLVVSGHGVIRFRAVDAEKILEYFVSADKLEVLDIPVGYTHNIENLGDTDMVTIMWASDNFDYERPDTYYLEV